ncbi:right-handed parallel beta-helix repeat-containing protein [Haloarcula brevis]|uniref:right-handed parallel beta-helix repeat-containing protein n=1 Tax=Haloarcula brevis TaxID=3111453 RepID=UPI00300F0196
MVVEEQTTPDEPCGMDPCGEDDEQEYNVSTPTENNSTNDSVSGSENSDISEPDEEPAVSKPTAEPSISFSDGRVINVDQDTAYDDIQPAVNDANPGDTLRADTGTYEGQHEYEGYGAVAIINKSITLIAEDGAVLKGTGTQYWANNPTSAGFVVTADDVTIRGFDGTNHNTGIALYDSDNTVIEATSFDNGNIWATGSDGASFIGNDVTRLSFCRSSDVTVRGNTVENQLAVNNGADGAYVVQNDIGWLFVGNGANVEVDENSITRVQVQKATLDAHDNTITGSNEYGVEIMHSTATLTNNVITGNNGGVMVTMLNDNFPTSDVTLRYNQLYDNNVQSSVNLGDVALDDGRTTIDARQNYWGQSGGPNNYQLKRATHSYPEKIDVSDHCTKQGCSDKK